jgi:hypothetical protein
MDCHICSKDARVVVNSLTGIHIEGEVPLCFQQKLYTQKFLGVPTGKNPYDSNLVILDTMQWVLLYQSIGHDRHY